MRIRLVGVFFADPTLLATTEEGRVTLMAIADLCPLTRCFERSFRQGVTTTCRGAS